MDAPLETGLIVASVGFMLYAFYKGLSSEAKKQSSHPVTPDKRDENRSSTDFTGIQHKLRNFVLDESSTAAQKQQLRKLILEYGLHRLALVNDEVTIRRRLMPRSTNQQLEAYFSVLKQSLGASKLVFRQSLNKARTFLSSQANKFVTEQDCKYSQSELKHQLVTSSKKVINNKQFKSILDTQIQFYIKNTAEAIHRLRSCFLNRGQAQKVQLFRCISVFIIDEALPNQFGPIDEADIEFAKMQYHSQFRQQLQELSRLQIGFLISLKQAVYPRNQP